MATSLQEQRTWDAAAPVPASTVERFPTTRHLLLVLAVLAIIAALKLAQAAVVPVLFAVFLALLLAPAIDALSGRRIPRSLVAGLLMILLIAVVAASLSVTWKPARTWLEAAPTTLRKLEAKLRPVTHFIAKVESVSTQAGRMTETPANARNEPTPVAVEPKGILESTQEWAISIVSMMFLMFFLLAVDLGAAFAARGPPGSPWGQAGYVIARMRVELGRYFAAVTFSNLLLGTGTATAMYFLEMPNPLLWGALAFVLNFVPYAGSATTLGLLTIVALVSFDGVGKAMVVAGTYLVLTTLEGQVVQPVLVGRRLDISPLVVLVGLWFGGWLWGVAGIALAMPVLVSVKAALHEVARSRAGEPTTDAELDTVRRRAAVFLRQHARRRARAESPASSGSVAR